jgi:hypothetical protein
MPPNGGTLTVLATNLLLPLVVQIIIVIIALIMITALMLLFRETDKKRSKILTTLFMQITLCWGCKM